MNHRIRKKIKKRLGCKSYVNARMKLIEKKIYESDLIGEHDLVIIDMDRRFKRLQKITLLKNIQPSGCSEVVDNEIVTKFDATPVPLLDPVIHSAIDGMAGELLDKWKQYIKDINMDAKVE